MISRKLSDGQVIYVLGSVSPSIMHMAMDSDGASSRWDRSIEVRTHYAVRRMSRDRIPEIHEWLKQNNALVTFWVEPEVFSGPRGYTGEVCDWVTKQDSKLWIYQPTENTISLKAMFVRDQLLNWMRLKWE